MEVSGNFAPICGRKNCMWAIPNGAKTFDEFKEAQRIARLQRGWMLLDPHNTAARRIMEENPKDFVSIKKALTRLDLYSMHEYCTCMYVRKQLQP